jgi:hypothetical protein
MSEFQRDTTFPQARDLYPGVTNLRDRGIYTHYSHLEVPPASKQIYVLNLVAQSYPREELWQEGIRTVGSTHLNKAHLNGGPYVDRDAWAAARDATPADYDLVVIGNVTARDYVRALSDEMVARCVITSDSPRDNEVQRYDYLRNVPVVSAYREPLAAAIAQQLEETPPQWREPRPDMEFHWQGY